MTWLDRFLLGIGGLTAVALAVAILVVPGPFYTGYGIEPDGNVSLLNELKAPALVILALGVFQALALFGKAGPSLGLGAGLLLYLGFGASRLIAMVTDGLPSTSLVIVAVVEILLGFGFATTLWRHTQR